VQQVNVNPPLDPAASSPTTAAEAGIKLHVSIADYPVSDTAPDSRPAKPGTIGKRLIRLGDLFALLDVGKATGHRLIAAGKIGPRAIRLTSACVRFDADEVSAWLSERRPDGSLYDARSWPAVWEMLKKRR
jgi:predicted DNA-binding transcriptional regulator AlpA